MQKSYRFLLSALILGSLFLGACTAGVPAGGSGGVEGSNSNDSNVNTNGDDGNLNDNANGNDNANTNANSNDRLDDDSEIFGLVEAITDDSVTIGGVTYLLANFTEFKDIISVGDQVKIHVIVNSDGTLTIREIERSSGGDDDNSNDSRNSNINGNSNDDNSNDDDSSNGNSNDDNSNDDDDDDDDNSNDDDNDDSNDNDD